MGSKERPGVAHGYSGTRGLLTYLLEFCCLYLNIAVYLIETFHYSIHVNSVRFDTVAFCLL